MRDMSVSAPESGIDGLSVGSGLGGKPQSSLHREASAVTPNASSTRRKRSAMVAPSSNESVTAWAPAFDTRTRSIAAGRGSDVLRPVHSTPGQVRYKNS